MSALFDPIANASQLTDIRICNTSLRGIYRLLNNDTRQKDFPSSYPYIELQILSAIAMGRSAVWPFILTGACELNYVTLSYNRYASDVVVKVRMGSVSQVLLAHSHALLCLMWYHAMVLESLFFHA